MALRRHRTAPCVSLLLWDGERVYLVRRDGSPSLFPHAWTLPGSPLVAGESPEAGARRVAQETLRITPDTVRVLRELPQPSPFRHERGPDTLVRVATWEGDPAPRLATWDRGGWFTLDQMQELRTFREAREVIAKACDALRPAGVAQ
jgi:ADP-ribose pyrophosphatase YjhB (NUDIX family)